MSNHGRHELQQTTLKSDYYFYRLSSMSLVLKVHTGTVILRRTSYYLKLNVFLISILFLQRCYLFQEKMSNIFKSR